MLACYYVGNLLLVAATTKLAPMEEAAFILMLRDHAQSKGVTNINVAVEEQLAACDNGWLVEPVALPFGTVNKGLKACKVEKIRTVKIVVRT
jgi:hypothetical protein